MISTRWIVAAGLAAAAASASHADIFYHSQSRTLFNTGGFGGSLSDMRSAPDFAPWNETLVFAVPSDDSRSVSTQNSRLDPLSITAVGTVEARDGIQTSFSSARSELNVLFALTAPADFRLVGEWSAFDGTFSGGGATVRLSTAAGTTLFESVYVQGGPTTVTFDVPGTLQTGVDYRLFVTVYASASMNPGTTMNNGRFDVTFTIPAPGSLAALSLGLLAARRPRR